MEEIWKEIEDHTRYSVSTFGRVRSNVSHKIMSPYKKRGYDKVQVISNIGVQKKPSIHRLVAKAFISNPENKPDIHHIDHDKSNNRIDNLMWVTPQENNSYNLHNFNRIVNHCPKSVACPDYFEVHGILFRTLTSAADKLNLSRQVIKDLCLKGNIRGFRYHPPKFY